MKAQFQSPQEHIPRLRPPHSLPETLKSGTPFKFKKKAEFQPPEQQISRLRPLHNLTDALKSMNYLFSSLEASSVSLYRNRTTNLGLLTLSKRDSKSHPPL